MLPHFGLKKHQVQIAPKRWHFCFVFLESTQKSLRKQNIFVFSQLFFFFDNILDRKYHIIRMYVSYISIIIYIYYVVRMNDFLQAILLGSTNDSISRYSYASRPNIFKIHSAHTHSLPKNG